MPKEKWLTIADLAEELGVAPRTIYDWRWRGLGPRGVKVNNNAVRFRRRDVDHWLEQHLEPRPYWDQPGKPVA